MASSRIGTPNAGDSSSDPNAGSDDLADDFLREVAHVDELPPPSEPRIGHAFGRFRIVAELGRGGMGIVYLAHDESLQRSVALKLLRPSLSRHDERQRRFLREARAAAAVTHPNLTTIYDVGEIDGRAFIAMERLDGTSLRRRIASGPLPIAEAVRIALSVLAGLEQAHRAGFVHRDLKPDNVIVTASGAVKLLDFGLAKQYRGAILPSEGRLAGEETGGRDTAAGQLLGTPAYMSPEQVRGVAVDPRSDIFSFGVLFYEMLVGARPFAAQSPAELQSAILRDEPRPIGEQRAGVPPALERVVERCLRKEPSQRYPSCDAIAEDLTQAQGQPQPPARRRAIFALAAGSSLALTGGALLWQRTAPGAGSTATTSPAVAASTAPTLAPVPVTALPLPASNSAEALAAYSASLQAARDGNWGYVTSLLERAVALDPTLAIAHLRLAIYYHYDGPHLRAGWAAFGRALLGRSSLNERDQALLEAYEPLYRDPSDRHEVIARLRAATARFPNDAEFHSLLAFMSIEPGDALAAARRTLELDPRSADGWQSLGANLIRVGDTEDGLRALDRCVAISPAAADCRAERGFIHSVEGRCVEMEEDFRAALAGSRSVIWQNGLANALFALGRPLEASLEIYRNKWSQLPEDTRTVTELMDRANLALAVGHFAEAERSGLEARRQMATDLDARTQARVALLLVQTYTETGRLRDAGRIADDFMRRKAGWISSAPFENASIRMYWAMLRAGLLNRERFIEMRDAWLRESEPHAQGALRAAKVAAYASGVETESEARETVQLFPDWESILVDADLMRRALTFGRLYAFTGRSREAAPLLEKVARWCGALSAPMEYVEASFLFGRAQEDVGNTAGACAAYGNVLHFWGDATPPSRTARRARARWLALECKEAPKTRRTL